MAISASRYTVGTGFKGVLLVYVKGILLYICCMVTENYSTKCLELKQTEKTAFFPDLNPPKKPPYRLIRNALPWLRRYGLVFLHFNAFLLAQKKANNISPHTATQQSWLQTSSRTQPERIKVPRFKRCDDWCPLKGMSISVLCWIVRSLCSKKDSGMLA